MHADIELGDVESEQLDAPTQRGEPAVGNPLSAMRAQRRVDDLEVGHELVHVAVPAWLALGRLQQPLVHQPQLAPVRLIVCGGGDLGRSQAASRCSSAAIEVSSASFTSTSARDTPIVRAMSRTSSA